LIAAGFIYHGCYKWSGNGADNSGCITFSSVIYMSIGIVYRWRE